MSEKIWNREVWNTYVKGVNPPWGDQVAINAHTICILELSFYSNLKFLEVVRQTISEAIGVLPFSAFHIHDICMAVDESLANVILHSYGRESTESPILLNLQIGQLEKGKKGVRITITDKGQGGKGFSINRSLVFDTMEEFVEKEKKGGLGVHLVKCLMDKVEYFSQVGGENELVMIKYLPNEK